MTLTRCSQRYGKQSANKNDAALHLLGLQGGRLCHRSLSRRSQNGHVPWTRMHQRSGILPRQLRELQEYRETQTSDDPLHSRGYVWPAHHMLIEERVRPPD